MLRIVFFARVKEELGCDNMELELEGECATVGLLKQKLYARDNGRWREVLSEDNIICAVNHTVAEDNTPLAAGDEVAFFPPVTGG